MKRVQFDLRTACIVMIGAAAGIGVLSMYFKVFDPSASNTVMFLTVLALGMGLSEGLRNRARHASPNDHDKPPAPR